MTKRLFQCLLLLSAAPLFAGAAGQRPRYPCYRIPADFVPGGETDAAVWNALPEASGFFILAADGYALQKPASFMAGWTGDSLYIMVRCEESSPAKMRAKLKDGDPLFSDDSVEFLFFPEKTDTCFHLAANSLGSRWNARGSAGSSEKIWDWQAKGSVDKSSWSLAARIPFAALGITTPGEGEQWPVNIARNLYTGPSSEHYTCWPPLKTGFHEVSNFGIFTFRETSVSGTEKQRVEETLNFPYHLFLQKKAAEMAGHVTEFKETLSDGLQIAKFRKEASSLKDSWELLEKITAREKPDFRELSSFFIRNTDLIKKSRDFRNRVLMESLFE